VYLLYSILDNNTDPGVYIIPLGP